MELKGITSMVHPGKTEAYKRIEHNYLLVMAAQLL